MKVKEYKSLAFNGLDWQAFQLAESTILLECGSSTPISALQEATGIIEDVLGKRLDDIVTSYHSIAIFTKVSINQVIEELSFKEAKRLQEKKEDNPVLRIPICYEFEMDLQRVAEYNQLSTEEVIEHHLNATYRPVVIGFTPGFVYSDGLDEAIHCPRLENPRNRVPTGSIGIGGNQTGIYSLASPGGWNIIGRTPMQLFDKTQRPPLKITLNTQYQFFKISKAEFKSWV